MTHRYSMGLEQYSASFGMLPISRRNSGPFLVKPDSIKLELLEQSLSNQTPSQRGLKNENAKLTGVDESR